MLIQWFQKFIFPIFRKFQRQHKADMEKSLLRIVFDTASVLIGVMEPNGKILQVNRMAEITMDCSLAELRGRFIWEFLDAEEKENVKAVISRLKAGDFPNQNTNNIVARGGVRRRVLWTNSALLDESGDIKYIIGTGIDMTDYYAVQEQYRKMAAALEAIGEAVLITDLEGKIQFANLAFERLTGYSREEVIGLNPRILKSGRMGPEFYDRMWSCLVRGEIWNGTIINRCKNGTFITLEETIAPIRGAAGLITNYVAVERDVTDRKKMEETLKKNEKHSRALIEKILDVIVIVGRGGVVHYISPSILHVLGYKPFELEGKDIFDFISPDDITSVKSALNDALERGLVETRVEIRVRNRDGLFKTLEAVGSSLENDSGGERVVVTARDITERKRLEGEILEIGNRERNRIGQDIHDGLGQHLTGISFLGKALQKKLEGKGLPEAKEIGDIVELVNEANQKTRQILQGLFPVELDSKGLAYALERLAVTTEKVFSVKCRFSCGRNSLVQDHERALHLYRIAQEAVNNAVKHGKATDIHIGLAQRDNRVTLSIVDDGVGISAGDVGQAGIGLHTMSYRAKAIGASLDIRKAYGGGTIVICKAKS